MSEPVTTLQELAPSLAQIALDNIDREFPYAPAHVVDGAHDRALPRELHPAFYGSYDWHSAVHGHWLLARLARRFPDAPFAAKARAALDRSLTPEHIAAEVKYLEAPGRTTFDLVGMELGCSWPRAGRIGSIFLSWMTMAESVK